MDMMAEIPKEILELYANTQINILPETYLIIGIAEEEKECLKQALKDTGKDFLSTVSEGDMITLIISKREWESISENFTNPRVRGPFNILRLDTERECKVAGYLAFTTRLLAGMEVNARVISGYKRDYIIIKEEDLPTAVGILFKFTQNCRERIKKEPSSSTS
jgi:hypothetical protein